MARKRSYDVNSITSEYIETLGSQDKREASETENTEKNIELDTETGTIESVAESATEQTGTMAVLSNLYEEEYVNPDQEEYKRMSLFMDWETWERIQALCWNENESINKTVVDKLREWSLDVPDEILEKYRKATKQKHLDEWSRQRDVLQFWWQTSGIRDQMNIKSFNMNRNTLTVIETTGTVTNYYIHRGWITDGQNRFAKEKVVLAQLKRVK